MYIYAHPHPNLTPLGRHQAELSVLYSSFPLALCFTHDSE